MATAAQGTSAVVEKAPKKQVVVDVAAPSRREFLYYIWGGSMALLLGQATAGLIWFALPRFREGEFGGTFRFSGGDIPAAGEPPLAIPEGRFHIAHLEDGRLVTLYGVCTHLGCLPKWDDPNVRFNCPCHGSQYNRDGTWITGPAPRGLDRFRTTVSFTNGEVEQQDEVGTPIPVNGREISEIAIDTGDRVNGPAHGVTL
ncbi:MAG: Rieske 2Fe-2S domain-containing protein [bacterium]|nr:Rieske 2Fe-2S domain-containing protein [bacterium]